MYVQALRRLKRNPQLFIITMMGIFGGSALRRTLFTGRTTLTLW